MCRTWRDIVTDDGVVHHLVAARFGDVLHETTLASRRSADRPTQWRDFANAVTELFTDDLDAYRRNALACTGEFALTKGSDFGNDGGLASASCSYSSDDRGSTRDKNVYACRWAPLYMPPGMLSKMCGVGW